MGLTGNILITGGTGTLGHAIARAAAVEGWNCRLTIYSRSELRQAQMRAQYPQHRYIIGDVTNYASLYAAMAGHDTVIHAAAMKRIPECEAQPYECIRTNVEGSALVARAAVMANVKLCIGISTDKACRAITAYGASKLMMESIWQAQPPDGYTRFNLVRYGNVVSSNGSVIPSWRQQHAKGRPLTVTDNRMTRFWMSPSDAVDLIVRASREAPGTILVPKMGSLSIREMAEIICPGATFSVTGLRSCEKLHEDLVHTDEPATETPTHYRIGVGQGGIGYSYTSEHAPRLSADTFLAMIEDAEAVYA